MGCARSRFQTRALDFDAGLLRPVAGRHPAIPKQGRSLGSVHQFTIEDAVHARKFRGKANVRLPGSLLQKTTCTRLSIYRSILNTGIEHVRNPILCPDGLHCYEIYFFFAVRILRGTVGNVWATYILEVRDERFWINTTTILSTPARE